uniref:TOG domain-containing protein n=1 Tax=Chromera velia CCMP2878 TaxID=1169474 RepID=A0A0G4H9R9_9ALVE|eukprot:Cvel_25372.t1-p1 / transcript=Cvel_25372.t1 / gene=Cvel_25372 / organism=Chromera_velia_CCMP2878 / gene_product=hypothetical protein / transcript_product=hypothetical protein / location=Cvel_scaffold2865:12127-22141(+) / protein_length=840 / sequence_SO=supercontig / SO=protein_coding / is_pseudo=false
MTAATGLKSTPVLREDVDDAQSAGCIALEQMSDSRHLTRERGQRAFRQALLNATVEELDLLSDVVLEQLDSASSSWESRFGGVQAATTLVQKSEQSEWKFHDSLRNRLPVLVEDPEARVRQATAELIGALCRRDGGRTYERLEICLFDKIQRGFTRRRTRAQLESAGNAPERVEVGGRQSAWVVPDALHDTEGWRSLETCMLCVEGAMRGSGEAFTKFLSEKLLTLLIEACNHKNRFVREISFRALGTACGVCESSVFEREVGPLLAPVFAQGLADNWSQVRFASAEATRAFMRKAGTTKQKYFDILLPPMCLNRRYVAEGVRSYSLETWRQVVPASGGAQLLLECLEATVDFMVGACDAPNHAVREAACLCIGELATKVAPADVSGRFNSVIVGKLLEALCECLNDASWPVREAACDASADFVSALPNCVESSMRLRLYDLWRDCLSDNIPKLRETAAKAMGKGCAAFPVELEGRCFELLETELRAVQDQPAHSSTFTQYAPSGPFSIPARKPGGEGEADVGGVSVVARLGGDDRDEEHTDQPMYSCGSLAPRFSSKMTSTRRAKAEDAEGEGGAEADEGASASGSARKQKDTGGGCMRCAVERRRQPWERTEGAIHLLVAVADRRPVRALELVDLALSTFELTHFKHFAYLLATVSRALPQIFKSIMGDQGRPRRRPRRGIGPTNVAPPPQPEDTQAKHSQAPPPPSSSSIGEAMDRVRQILQKPTAPSLPRLADELAAQFKGRGTSSVWEGDSSSLPPSEGSESGTVEGGGDPEAVAPSASALERERMTGREGGLSSSGERKKLRGRVALLQALEALDGAKREAYEALTTMRLQMAG